MRLSWDSRVVDERIDDGVKGWNWKHTRIPADLVAHPHDTPHEPLDQPAQLCPAPLKSHQPRHLWAFYGPEGLGPRVTSPSS